MGNEVSYTPEQITRALESNYSFIKIKERATKMGINIIIQGDGSIQIQNTKHLVKGNSSIPAPSSPGNDDIGLTITNISNALEKMSSDCGYSLFTYQ